MPLRKQLARAFLFICIAMNDARKTMHPDSFQEQRHRISPGEAESYEQNALELKEIR